MAKYRSDRGYWQAYFMMKYPDGTSEMIRRKSPRNTKRAAERFERELHDQLLAEWRAERDGIDVDADVPTLKAFKTEFLAWCDANVKKSTRDSYESILRTGLIPVMGSLELDEIGARHVEQYKGRKKVSPKTMRNHIGVLTKLLNVARRYELLERVPEFDLPSLGRRDPGADELEYWSFDEADRVLEKCGRVPHVGNIVRLALATGLRQSELCGLQWGDVDLERGTLLVRRQLYRGRVTTPKTETSIRRIPLSDEARSTLKDQMAHTYMRARPGEDWVFLTPDGEPYNYDRIKDAYWRLVHLAKVTRITFHGLRHTFASHCVMRGVPLEVLQKWLGHASIQETQRYAHLAPDHSDRFIELLNEPTDDEEEQANG